MGATCNRRFWHEKRTARLGWKTGKILTKEGLPSHLELHAGELRQPGLQPLLADVTPWSDGVADNVDGDLLDRANATGGSAAGHRRDLSLAVLPSRHFPCQTCIHGMRSLKKLEMSSQK